MLEVIDKRSVVGTGTPGNFFAEKGFRAVAVSLRGHGANTLSKPLNSVTFSDYVDDVRSAVDMLGSEPVLIGHSLGGSAVQKYLENRRAQPRSCWRLTRHSGCEERQWQCAPCARHPWRRARESLFCESTPQVTVESCAARVQPGE